jgi:hypothetical protein
MSQYDQKYKNFWSEKMLDLGEMYETDIEHNQGTKFYMNIMQTLSIFKSDDDRQLGVSSDWVDREEDLDILKFISTINTCIEIVDGGKHTWIYFRKHPTCFFLSPFIRKDFFSTVSTDNNAGGMSSLITMYKYFSIEMEANYETYSKYKLWYYITTDDVYNTISWVTYLQGFVINVVCAWEIKWDDTNRTIEYESKEGEQLVKWLSVSLIVINSFVLLTYLYVHYFKNRKMAIENFKIKNPTLPLYSIWGIINFNLILPVFRKQIGIVTILAILIACLGLW